MIHVPTNERETSPPITLAGKNIHHFPLKFIDIIIIHVQFDDCVSRFIFFFFIFKISYGGLSLQNFNLEGSPTHQKKLRAKVIIEVQ